MSAPTSRVVRVIALAAVALCVLPRFAAAQDEHKEVHKNVKVLRGLSQAEMHRVMEYISGALGMRCTDCHAGGGGKPVNWESDEKVAKKTARKMIEMVFDINKRSFDDDLEVTCWTCHRGHAEPASVPVLGAAAEMVVASTPAKATTPAASLPKLPDVLAKYEKALGGKVALDKWKTRTAKALLETGESPPWTIEQTQKAPGASLVVIISPRGEQRRGTDGKVGWAASPRGQRDVTGADLDEMRADGDFLRDIKLKDRLPDLRVLRRERLGAHDVVVVQGTAGKRTERFYFDATSGLPVRKLILHATPVGPMPEQMDFEDWRDVAGVKEPFVVRITPMEADEAQTIRYQEIKHNGPVADAVFAKPLAAPTSAPKPGP